MRKTIKDVEEKAKNEKLSRNIIIGILTICLFFSFINMWSEDRLIGFESNAMKHEISVIGDRMCGEKNCTYDTFVNVPNTGVAMDKIICDCSEDEIIDFTK